MPSARDFVRDAFDAMLADGPLLLSGGFGTELQRRGVDTRLPLWAAAALVNDPRAVRRLHADYLEAGAAVLTANTFRTDPHAVAASGLGVEAEALTGVAVRLAREAVAAVDLDRPVLVAGSAGPVRECYRPDEVPGGDVLRAEHEARIEALLAAGADLVLVETMNCVREAVAALEAARDRLPSMVSFVCGGGGRLLSGETVAEAVDAVEAFDPLAIGVNCCSLGVASEALEHLLSATRRPVGVYANGVGRPDDVHGWCFAGGATDDEYVAAARGWLDRGARLVGGCCGTSPGTIRALRALLRERSGRT